MQMESVQPQPEIDSLRWLLGEWARWVRAWKPKLGAPRAVAYVGLMRPGTIQDVAVDPDTGEQVHTHDWSKVDVWRMQTTDACVESLPQIQRHAIYRRYLSAELGSQIADQAEQRLLVLVVARGVVL